jgi:3-oxoacyl-[acyl-carrier protein] reductase
VSDLKGRVALITGSSSGIGAAVAAAFADLGASVVVNSVSSVAEGEQLAATLPEAIYVQADVSNPADAKRLVAATVERYGRLDIVVNNAGTTHANGPMLEVDEATYDRVFAVNVKSIYWSAICAVPVLRRQGGGSIINIASTAGLRPRPGLTWYNGSKGAAVIISKSMAVELAPDNIRVNAICPVIGETGLTSTFMGGDTPELRAKFVASIPLGRMSRPEDIAGAALYLASDRAAFLTGTALEVDGGRCV